MKKNEKILKSDLVVETKKAVLLEQTFKNFPTSSPFMVAINELTNYQNQANSISKTFSSEFEKLNDIGKESTEKMKSFELSISNSFNNSPFMDAIKEISNYNRQASLLSKVFTSSIQPTLSIFSELSNSLNQNNITSEYQKFSNIYDSNIQNLVTNLSISKLAIDLPRYSIDVFEGMTLGSLLDKTSIKYNNSIIKTSIPISSGVLKNGDIRLKLTNTIQSSESEIIYKRFDNLDINVELLDKNFRKSNAEVLERFELQIKKYDTILETLYDDPFSFFRIRTFKFLKSNSTFIINETIKITLESKTNLDKLCQVLFSEHKEDINEEWETTEIQEVLELIEGYAEAEKFGWKQIQEAVSTINKKISQRILIKDAILSTRKDIVQLNPLYFSSKK